MQEKKGLNLNASFMKPATGPYLIVNAKIKGEPNLKYLLVSLGISMTIIFGGGFLIRFVSDSDFYIAEFIGGMVGIIILIIGIFSKGTIKPPI